MDITNNQLRIRRHEKLMQMIHMYKPTPQQTDHLLKIKQDTQFQIAVRYIKSKQNKNYIFPTTGDDNNDDDEEDIDKFPGRVSFQQTFYDLNVQNYIPSPQKIQRFIKGRRVKSLGSEKGQERYNNAITQRLNQKGNNKVIRINLPKIQSSKLIFKSVQKPFLNEKEDKRIIRVIPIKKKNIDEQHQKQQFRKLFGKKLLTQHEQILKIGATKITTINNTITKRIHSPSKFEVKHKKLLTQL